MDSKERVVVVGGGYAGVLASIRAARRLRGLARVTLVSDSDAFVERIRLHEAAARGTTVHRPLATLLAGTGVELVVGRVERIDRAAARLYLAASELAYDRLVLATGTTIDRRRIPGADVHAHTLDNRDVASVTKAVRSTMARGGRVLVVGGGLTGVEAATELAEANPGLAVALVTSGCVGERMTEASVAHVRHALQHLGVEVHENVRVEAITSRGIETTRGFLGAEMTLLAAGFRAASLGAQAGLDVDAIGRVRVTPTLGALDAPHVYAIGDGAVPLVDPGSPLPMGCKSAMPMGAHVADVLAAELRGEAPTPFNWRDVALCVSLGRRNGILQFMRSDGTPASVAVKGRFGAFLKESICRFTVAGLRSEARGVAYRWFHTASPKCHALTGQARPELAP